MNAKVRLGLCILAAFVPAVIAMVYVMWKNDGVREVYLQGVYRSMPVLSAHEVRQRLDEIEKIARAGIHTHKQYLDLVVELDRLEFYSMQAREDASRRFVPGEVEGFSINCFRARNMLTGAIAIDVRKLQFNKNVDMSRARSVFLDGPHGDYSMFYAAFGFGWIVSMLLVRSHFNRQIREKGGKVWLAMVSSARYWYCVVVWPHGLSIDLGFDPRRQLRQALRLCGMVLSAIVSIGGAGAQTKKSAGEERTRRSEPVTWTLEQSFLPRYHGLNGGVFHQAPVVQSSITAAGRNWALGLWHSAGLDDTSLSSNFGDEVDLFGSYTGTISGFKLTGGLMLFNIVPTTKTPVGDIVQPEVRVSRNVTISSKHQLVPFLWARYPFPAGSKTPKSGLFVHYGTSHSWRLSGRVGLDHAVDVLQDAHGAFGFSRAFVAGWYGKIRLKITERFELQAPFRLSAPLSKVNDGRRPTATVGLGWAYSF